MPVANSYHKNSLIIFDPIDDDMRPEGMNSYRRIDLIPFAGDPRIGSYQLD